MSKFVPIEDCAIERTAVVVLSAGASAARATGDLLTALGCDAPASERNGISKLTELNEAVLESSGISNNNWVGFNTRWLASPKGSEFSRRALELLKNEFGGSYLSVMQDAAAARLVPFWNLVFDRAGVAPRYLLIVSDPAEFAEDLHDRFQIAHAAGHLIWLRAALDAEANTRGRLRAFAHAAELGHSPAPTIDAVAKSLNLVLPRDVQTAFASENFRRKEIRGLLQRRNPAAAGPQPVAMPDWVTATYEILKDWASKGEGAAARTVLDAVREAFDEAIPAFLGIGLSAASTNGEYPPENNAKLRDGEPDRESARGADRVELNELRHANEERTQALEDVQEQLRARYSEIVTLTRMLASETAAARKFERNAKRLGGIAQALERGTASGGISKWLDSILPWSSHLRRAKRIIEREGLFDGEAYLRANADVQNAGIDPLRHYLAHGASEGRPLGIE